ncbi:MAG: general stress protein [Flavobacterium sp.]|nr:MAG: general stress protein [Flavobacterium sp.]
MAESKDNYKDLFDKEAIAKIKELAEDINICMFCTELSQRPVPTRPMSIQEVDEQGNIWFISSAKSNKNFEIKHDDEVQLIFAKNADAHFLSVFGRATIYTDRAHIEEQWSPMAKAWFDEGKEDPDVTIIKVAPIDAYYWDTKNGKMISMLKWMAGTITGEMKDDGGIEGKLNV